MQECWPAKTSSSSCVGTRKIWMQTERWLSWKRRALLRRMVRILYHPHIQLTVVDSVYVFICLFTLRIAPGFEDKINLKNIALSKRKSSTHIEMIYIYWKSYFSVTRIMYVICNYSLKMSDSLKRCSVLWVIRCGNGHKKKWITGLMPL